LRASAGLGAAALLQAFRPVSAAAMQVGRGLTGRSGAREDPLQFGLRIGPHTLSIDERSGAAMGINDSIPGPLLEWQEGRDVVLDVVNALGHDTSIHWHGILLPFEMDGVPGVTFKGIPPGTTFQYRFPVVQSGTYWYHSHSGLQKQTGVYGPLVIHPEQTAPLEYDRDYVVMLSDWTFEDPHRVLARLKKMGDYYNFRQFSVAELYGSDDMSAAEAMRTKLAWDRMRMMPTDIADVTGATYTYLMNGLHPGANWTVLFRQGERVRLRFINGSAMSYFNVRVPELPMTVVAADGQDVVPVETDELQLGVAETYDVIVRPGANEAYTIMAEAMDRSGFAAGTLATRPGLRAPLPALRKRPLLTMVDMGMDMSDSDAGVRQGHHGHADRSAHGVAPATGSIVAYHGSDTHGPGNADIAAVQRDRLRERGTGLEDVPHRVLVYTDLQRLADDFDPRPPTREIELHLTGHMERYMWSFDGEQFHEVKGPIEFNYGERLRLILVNDTMMNHPIHLHGMWMELENGHTGRLPRKHTINIMPAARVSALINADAPGRWAFHCHLLYHMEMGMFRVVRVA
jgi:CopA family copper-resistance protein